MTDPDSELLPDAKTAAKASSTKKKKRRRKKKAEQSHRRPVLDEDGRERPLFLLDFPEHPELEELIRAFEQGNFALVRRKAPELARKVDDDAVRAAALELRRRIDPDPLLRYMLLISIALLAFLIFYAYFLHGH
jgi:hypothetical protein